MSDVGRPAVAALFGREVRAREPAAYLLILSSEEELLCRESWHEL